MRNRFKPNLSNTPRRGANSQQQGSSERRTANEAENVSSRSDEVSSAQTSTHQESVDVPFVPPYCQNYSCEVEQVNKGDDGITEKIIVEPTRLIAGNTTKDGESQNDVPKPPSSASTTTRVGRRSRIKPSVTPVARSRPAAAGKVKKVADTSVELDGGDGKTRKTASTPVTQSRSSTANKDKQPTEKSMPDYCDGETISSEPVALFTQDASNSASSTETSQPVPSSTASTTTSPNVTNIEQRSQPVAMETLSNIPDIGVKRKAADESATQSVETSGTPALLRRKRVLPNLGSASRRRRSSVSKDNAEKIVPPPDVACDDSVVDKEMAAEPSLADEGSTHGSKRLRTISEGENTADQGEPSTTVLESHEEIVEEDEEEGKKKGQKRRRGGRPHKLKEPSDPSQMTMQHLIYCNPKSNPMKSKVDSKKKQKGGKKGNQRQSGSGANSQEKESVDPETTEVSPPTPSTPSQAPEPQVDETNADEGSPKGAAVAPRVKLSADGSIILDEESLLIPKSPEKSLNDSEIVYEDADEVNYVAYLKYRKVEKWTLEDTQKFYKALSQVGTDFSLMTPLFPSRQRKELKAKFKREEKLHRNLVEKALRLRNPIDVELFTPRVEGEEIDDAVAVSEENNVNPTTSVAQT